MIQLADIYSATHDGLDIILRYYPQAADVVGTKNKFRARQNEKTASACLHHSGGVWKVVDFGDDGHALSPIDICMKEDGPFHLFLWIQQRLQRCRSVSSPEPVLQGALVIGTSPGLAGC